jgi:hypothetical protein
MYLNFIFLSRVHICSFFSVFYFTFFTDLPIYRKWKISKIEILITRCLVTGSQQKNLSKVVKWFRKIFLLQINSFNMKSINFFITLVSISLFLIFAVQITVVHGESFEFRNSRDEARRNLLAQPTSRPTAFDAVAPFVLSAVLSADGRYCTLSFNTPTNKAGLSASSFPCADLLKFDGKESAVCLWQDSSTIAIYPDLTTAANIEIAINVGSSVSLLPGNKIYSSVCNVNSLARGCKMTDAQTIFVLGPLNPTQPTVSIASPKYISACSSWRLDFTGSKGDGQRGWNSPEITVVGSALKSDVTALKNYIIAGFTTAVPMSIPQTLLTVGETYDVKVTLCTVFYVCSTGSISVTVTNSLSSAPVVSLLGSTSGVIRASTVVSFTANAYVVGCGGTTSSIGLTYKWAVKQGGNDITLNSVIKVNQFTIPQYTLVAGNTYTVQVDVNDTVTALHSLTSNTFTVQASPLVAQITPNSMQLLRAGKSLSLSGASSFDPDDKDSLLGDILYTWSCKGLKYQNHQDSTCYLTLGEKNKPTLTIGADITAVNSTSLITLFITKGSKNSTATVVVKGIEGSAPLITMQTTTQAATQINPASSLLLSGMIQSDYAVGCSWSVNTGLALDKASLTPFTKQIPAASATLFNLVLSGNSLAVRSSYQFTLTCLGSSASIVVTTNGPPMGGIYSVSPNTGNEIEMTTPFQFTTSQWSDPDLPVTYLFGFISPSNGLLSAIQSRSSLAYATNTLPGGLSTNQFHVNTVVQSFDALNASAQLDFTVTVNPLPAASAQSAILSQLSATTGSTNLDAVKSLISVASSVISRVDCAGAPDCAALNREKCFLTAGTCGVCSTGYVGQSGSGNAPCLSASSASAGSTVQKQCLNGCSTPKGTCVFKDSTGGVKTTCSILEDCTPSCTCNTGFSGPDCSFTVAQLASQQSLRSTLLSSLSSVIDSEDTTADSVSNVVSSISGIIKSASDINKDALSTFSSIAVSTLQNSLGDSGISSEMLSGLLGPVNSAIDAHASLSGKSAALDLGSTILSQFANVLNRDSAVGLPATTYVQDNFRLVQQTVDASSASSLKLPQTAAEKAAGTPATSISVTPNSADSAAAISMQSVQYSAKLLSATNDKFSNIVSTQLSSTQHDVVLTLPNVAGKVGPSKLTETAQNFTTFCAQKDYGTYKYTCPGSNKVLTHTCHGIPGVLLAYCPIMSTVCGSVDLSTGSLTQTNGDFKCKLISMTAAAITCSCTPAARRRLSNGDLLENTGLLTAVAISEYTASEFGDTFKAAPALTSPKAIERALIVIIMFALLWAGGLTLILVCFVRQRQLQQESLERKLEDGRKAQQNSENSTLEEVRERLVRYVDSVFPVIFYPGHLLLRLKDEIRRNHRYLMMFMLLEGELEGKKRLINGIQLLTIQSALMFLLALLYDLQQPTDDGSCPNNLTELTCYAKKSLFDSSKAYCHWNPSPADGETSCTFNNYALSFKATIYIQVVVSVMSALIMRPLYYLFDILLAPNVDNIKAKLAEEAALKSLTNIGQSRTSMIGRMTRRVGRVANSVASIIKFAQPKQVDPKELENMPITLIPDEVEMVHNQAQAYFRKLTQRAEAYSEDAPVQQPEPHGRRMRYTMINKLKTRMTDFIGTNANDAVVAQKWEGLKAAIYKQRMELQAEEIPEFDKEWGLDSNGNFLFEKEDGSSSDGASKNSLSKEDYSRMIQKELFIVETKSKEMIDRLHLAVDSHIGLEILHKFILDILGRDTPAAVIFENKTDEDFHRTSVKTRRSKVFAALAIFAANALFVYYSILRGYVKGIEWQKSYLIACLVQMMLEIYLFETIECVWVNVFVPSLVANEVQRVNNTLLNIINDLCTKVSLGLKLDSKDHQYSLNVPEYLFVSTRVANKHPSLMESMIIRAYRSHLPGEFARKWNKEVKSHQGGWFGQGRNVSFPVAMVGSLMFTLQFAAMTPFEWQKMMIRFVQPFFYGGLVLLGRDIVKSPIYIAITAFVLFAIVAFLIYTYYRYELNDTGNTLAKISPTGMGAMEDDKVRDKEQMFAQVKKEMDLMKRTTRSRDMESKSQSRSDSDSDSENDKDKEYHIRSTENTRAATTNNRIAPQASPVLHNQKRQPPSAMMNNMKNSTNNYGNYDEKANSEASSSNNNHHHNHHTFQPAGHFRAKGHSSIESSQEEKSENGSYLLSSTEPSKMHTAEDMSISGSNFHLKKAAVAAKSEEEENHNQESEDDTQLHKPVNAASSSVATSHLPQQRMRNVKVTNIPNRSSNHSAGYSGVSMESFTTHSIEE